MTCLCIYVGVAHVFGLDGLVVKALQCEKRKRNLGLFRIDRLVVRASQGQTLVWTFT